MTTKIKLTTHPTQSLIDRLDINFALKAARLGVWELDPITGTIIWDARCRELFGLAADNPLDYEQAIRHIHPDDVSRVDAAVQQAMNRQSGGDYDITYRTIGADDGQLRYVRFAGEATFNRMGEVTRFAGIAQDVTQDELARQGQETANLLQAVFDSSLTGISVISSVRDQQGEIIDFDYRLVNHVTEQLNNRTDLVGKRYSAIHLNYKQAGIFDDFKEVIKTGQPIERERHYVGEGFDNWYETIAVKLDDSIVFSFLDITDTIRARQQLETGQQQMLDSFEQSPVGIAIIREENLTFRMVNSFYATLTGRTPNELTGKPLFEAMPELRGQGFDTLLRTVFATGKPFVAKEVAAQLVRHNRLETIYVDFTYKPQYDASNRVSSIMVVCVEVTEQVLARKAIETSERYFRQLTDTVPAVIWETRPDGYCTYLNGQWYDLTGQTPAEAEGFGWLDATHPDDKAEAGRLFSEANQKQTPFSLLYRLRQRDGLYRWAIDKGSPRFGADGSFEGMIGTVVDIHDQKIAEEEATRFRFMADNASDPFILMREDGTFAYLNQLALDRWGYTADEAADIRVPDVDPIYNDAVFSASFARAQTEQIPAFETIHRRKDGTTYPVEVNMGGLVLNGEPHMFAVARDITERKRNEQSLRESEQRFQAAVAAVQGILWTNNAEGEMEGEQPGWAALTGQTYDDYQGYGWANAVHPDDAQPTIDTWQEALVRQDTFIFEHRVRMKAGHYGQFSTRAIPLLNPDGTIREWVGVHTNVTEQRRAEAALRQSQEQQAFLLQLSDRLRSLSDPADIQYQAACVLGEYIGASRVGYAEDQNDGQHVVVTRNYTNGVSGIEGRYQYSDYGAALITELQAGRLVVRPDVAADSSLTEAEKEAHAMLQLGATVNLPLMKAGRMTGILFLHYNRPHDFSAQELNLLNETAERTWEAVERARVANALRVSEAKLRSLITAAPVAIGLFVGRDLVIDLPNQTFIDIVGKGPNIAGKPLREVMPELITENQPFLQILDDVYTSGKMFQSFGSLVQIVRQGVMTHNYYNITYSPLYNEAGEIYAILDVAVDVTGQILAQQQMAQSEAKLRSVVDTSPFPIALFVGREMRVELANQTIMDAWGKGNDVIGKPYVEVLPELTNQAVFDQLDEVYTTGIPFIAKNQCLELMIEGGLKPYYFNYEFTPVFDAVGQVYGVLNTGIDITETVLAQQQVTQSEARFQNLIRQASVGIVVLIGEEMRVEIVNDAYAQLIDRSGDAVLGKPLFSIIPEAESSFRPILDGVRTTGEPFYLHETPYTVWVDGGKKEGFLNVIYQPYREHDGVITGVTALCQNVTEQVLARRKIEESEARFRSLIMEAPVATCLFVGPTLVLDLVNPEMVKVMGKGETVIGKPLTEALPESVGQPFPALLAELYRTGNTHEGFSTPADLVVDGVLGTYYFDFTYKPLRNTADDVYAILCMAVDVTAQVLARRRIEEAEAGLRGAIELAELGTWSLDAVTYEITYSDRIKNWFGFDASAIALNDAYNPVHERDRSRVAAAISAALQPGSPGLFDEEYTLVDQQTGAERIIHAYGRAFFDAQGKPLRLRGTAQDVTRDRQLQQELERQVQQRTQQLQVSIQDLQRSNANLQQFAYVASHDLQEPLRKIQSFGDMIKNQYGEQLGETGNDFLGRMQTSASRMSTLIRDLLTYSRISTQQDTNTTVALDDVVSTVLFDLDLVINETNAVVEVASLPTVQGDNSQLGQLFQNLLSNALKFRKPGESPRISVNCQTVAARDLPPAVRPTRLATAYYCIDVTDNGIGFDEQYVDRIFQVFQRLHGRGQYIGTGIGLAICEKVAANHGGAITASSQPEKGATFSVYLRME